MTAPSLHIYYVSRDGQARKIAFHIAERLRDAGIAASPRDLATDFPASSEITGLAVLIAAVRYGKHLPGTDAFLDLYNAIPNKPKLVLFSVNLTARKPEKRDAQGSSYLRKLIAKKGLHPVLARAIAGRLDYPSYRPFDRFMIRFIMWMTKGPTDPTATIEFTDWQEVDSLAIEIAKLAR